MIYNSNTAAVGLVLSNSQGSFTLAVPPTSMLILNKNATDLVACNVAAANGFLLCNPIQRSP